MYLCLLYITVATFDFVIKQLFRKKQKQLQLTHITFAFENVFIYTYLSKILVFNLLCISAVIFHVASINL